MSLSLASDDTPETKRYTGFSPAQAAFYEDDASC